jgi:hypothetical protein
VSEYGDAYGQVEGEKTMMWYDHRYSVPKVTGDWRKDAISMALLVVTIVAVLAVSKLLTWIMEMFG